MKQLKNLLKYLISLAVGLGLLWYVYKDWDFSDMLMQLREVDYSWVIASVLLFILSNWIRAYRWNLLLKPLGYKPKLSRTFLAVMIVYFANLLAPRMGEVARCWALRKTENIPFTSSLGSVLAERIFDFFSLLSIVVVVFILQFDRLYGFMYGIFESSFNYLKENVFIVYLLLGFLLITVFSILILWKFFRDKILDRLFFQKAINLLRDVFKGVSSIRKVDNKLGFYLSTAFIWICYFLMSYLIFFSIPQTAHLGLWAGLSVLTMGGIGMTIPVQGGIGSFHAIVSSVLVLYGINKADGELFAFILHTAESIVMLIFGGVSVLIVLLIQRRNSKISS